jgi:hypothetical protein
MTNRVHIDAPAGVVEIEGEKEFVEGLLAKVFPLLEAAGFGSRPPNNDGATGDQSNDSSQADQPPADQNGKGKAKKRRVNAPPKGQSCADRITTLKQGGFFKDHKSVADIVAGLKVKGWTHNGNQVGAALTHMFGRGDIQRTKEGDSAWMYYWDRG